MNEHFDKRFAFGDIAVNDLVKYLEDKKIPYTTCKEYFDPHWSRLMGKLWGDIVLYPHTKKEIWIDVKYNSISEESATKFKGDYFWVFRYKTYKTHSTPIDNIILTRDDVFNLSLPTEYNQTLDSGSPGFKLVHKKIPAPIPDNIWETSREHLKNILGTS